MSIEEMASAIGTCAVVALDDLTRALWAGVASGEVGDEDAARLSDAIQARRKANVPVGNIRDKDANLHLSPAGQEIGSRGKFTSCSPRKRQRPPERSVAIERRRRLAASGPMPPALAARFTTGEAAVLRIVADEVKARQVCALCLDAIAARAGVSRTTAQNAIRQARRLGMVEVRERRRPGARSLPNLVTVIDREWLAWIKHHGFKKPNTTDKVGFREGGRRFLRDGSPQPESIIRSNSPGFSIQKGSL